MRVLFAGRATMMARSLCRELQKPGWTVDTHTNGSLVAAARRHAYDAIVIQTEDPDEAEKLCSEIRGDSNWAPLILCCGGEQRSDVAVRGLDAGADGFVVEPTSAELTALTRAMARNRSETRPAVLVVGDLELDSGSRTVTRAGRRISLTVREFALLEFLMRNSNLVLSRAAILDAVWGFDYIGRSNVVDVYVGYLRRKIDKPFGSAIIRSVRGIGYTIDAPVRVVRSEPQHIDLRDRVSEAAGA